MGHLRILYDIVSHARSIASTLDYTLKPACVASQPPRAGFHCRVDHDCFLFVAFGLVGSTDLCQIKQEKLRCWLDDAPVHKTSSGWNLVCIKESRIFSRFRGGLDGQGKGRCLSFFLSECSELYKAAHELPIIFTPVRT